MLGKLFKYEFRATGRLFLPMYALLLVMSGVTRLIYGLSRRDTAGMNLTALTVIVTIIMVMLFTAVWVVTLVFIIRRFWTHQLGREGYLTNVLPVSPAKHLCAKSVTGTVWTLASGVASVLALAILLGHTISLAVDFTSFGEFWHELWAAAAEEHITGGIVRFLIQTALLAMADVYLFIIGAYAAMCVGQLASKHRVLAAVAAYFGISTVQSIVLNYLFVGRAVLGYVEYGNGVFYRLEGAESARELLGIVNNEMLLCLGIVAVFCAALYFVCDLILKKRLNLQ